MAMGLGGRARIEAKIEARIEAGVDARIEAGVDAGIEAHGRQLHSFSNSEKLASTSTFSLLHADAGSGPQGLG